MAQCPEPAHLNSIKSCDRWQGKAAEMLETHIVAQREEWYGFSSILIRFSLILMSIIIEELISGVFKVNDEIEDMIRSSFAGSWLCSRWLKRVYHVSRATIGCSQVGIWEYDRCFKANIADWPMRSQKTCKILGPIFIVTLDTSTEAAT